jgi:hypothetical protein
MMQRRTFLAAAGAAATTLGAMQKVQGEDAAAPRQLYELRQYIVSSPEQRAGLETYLKEAAVPAWNRAGIKPVGVFVPAEGNSPVYVLLPHSSLESVAATTQKLLADEEHVKKGAALLNAPKDKPAFDRMESSLLLAFKGMPSLETPVKNPGRVFQLRIYESPSVKTGQKKIEMFNEAGEIKIFRRVGLNPVFFGESIVGSKMPNLTYMLGFESNEAQAAGWKKFLADPDWLKLRGMDEYADKNILSNITNLPLKPTEFSQI